MANKKFYYQSGNNQDESQPSVSASGKEQNEPNKSVPHEKRQSEFKQRSGRSKPDFAKQNGGARHDSAKQNGGARTDSNGAKNISKQGVGLEKLALSENTAALLNKYNIRTSEELAARTEKDMYRMQGFNKKMLAEVKGSLEKFGFSLKSDGVRNTVDSNAVNGKNPKRPSTRANNQPDSVANRGNKFSKGGAKNQNTARTQNNEPKQERLKEPLPLEQWRKIQKGGKWGFFDGFKTVIPAMYDEVFLFKDGLASVEIEEKCGYIDCENNIVIPLDYETAMSFSEGLASVVKNGKCGYINKNNEIIIPFEYDAATPFEDGEAKIKKDGKWGTITPDGAVKWI